MGLNWGEALSNAGSGMVNIAQRYIDQDFKAQDEQRRSDIALTQAQKLAEMQDRMAEEKRMRIGEKMKGEVDRLHGERFGDEARFQAYMKEHGMTEADIAEFGGKPAIIESLKQGGNYEANEIDKARVRADAASNLGLKDEETHARGILNSAISEKRADTADKRADSAESRANNQDAYNNRHLDETIRHNMALEKAALAKTGVEKLSPAAKVQLEIAGVGVSSAQKAEAEAARSLDAATKLMDPEQIKQAKSDYIAAKRAVDLSLTNYNRVGKAHLDGWKELDSPAPAPAANEIRYGADGKAYTKGPDGKPVLVESAALPKTQVVDDRQAAITAVKAKKSTPPSGTEDVNTIVNEKLVGGVNSLIDSVSAARDKVKKYQNGNNQ